MVDKKIGEYVISESNLSSFASGAYGTLFYCRKKNDKQKYVAKKIECKEDFINSIKAEEAMVYALKNIDCPYILKYEDCIEEENAVYFITKYCNDGNLQELISKEKFLNIQTVKGLFIHIVKALKEIHENSIIHRDLKPANIFLHKPNGKERIALLADFGFSTEKIVASTILGTPITMSPELLNEKTSTNSLDIWAAGVIIYNACFGMFPFDDKLRQSVEDGIYYIPKYFIISKDCIELIEHCLQRNVKRRITAHDMDKCNFLKSKRLTLYYTQKAIQMSIDKQDFDERLHALVKDRSLELIGEL